MLVVGTDVRLVLMTLLCLVFSSGELSEWIVSMWIGPSE